MKYNYFHLTIHRDLRKKKPVLRTDNPGASSFSSLQTYSTCVSLRSFTFLLHHLRSFEKTFTSGFFLQDALASVLCLAQCSKAPSPNRKRGQSKKGSGVSPSFHDSYYKRGQGSATVFHASTKFGFLQWKPQV